MRFSGQHTDATREATLGKKGQVTIALSRSVPLLSLLLVTICLGGSGWALPQPAVAQGLNQVLPPWQTVKLEHRDRMQRLRKLSKLHGVQTPEINEYMIPQEQHGLANYPVAIPIARVVFPDKAFFDFNKTNIRPEADVVVRTIGETLRHDAPDAAVFVAGHTDALEADERLGFQRARTVACALAKHSLRQQQIFLVSFGKTVPIATNETDKGRAQNRRVEFLFAGRFQAVAAWLARQKPSGCVPGGSEGCPAHFRFRAVEINSSTFEKRCNAQEIRLESKSVVIDLESHTFNIELPP